jgi:hypothetical protein
MNVFAFCVTNNQSSFCLKMLKAYFPTIKETRLREYVKASVSAAMQSTLRS